MVDAEHLDILMMGVEAWNTWRKSNPGMRPNLSGGDFRNTDLRGVDFRGVNLSSSNFSNADLSGADLSSANLSGVNFSNADLSESDLSGAKLRGADLSSASLRGANLFRADLFRTDLFRTDLSGADLRRADLRTASIAETDFTAACCAFTIFDAVNLSSAKGLDAIIHKEPSSIGIDTLFKSHGNIPEVFLRRCGVPEHLISYLSSLMEGKTLDAMLDEARNAGIENSTFGVPVRTARLQCDIFMVMPFADDFPPIYDDHIKPIAEGMGYVVKRGDDPFGRTSIMTDIWSAINNAKLVISECTGRNPNVFYEMGIAHTLDKPVIMITQNMDDIPFDIRHLRVIKYDYSPRGMRKFEADLTKAITNLLNDSAEG